MYMKMPVFHTLNVFGITVPFFNSFAIDTKYNGGIEWLVLVHYLSKYLDFFDTIFIILRKKVYYKYILLYYFLLLILFL